MYTACEAKGRFSGPEVQLLPLDSDSHRNRDGDHGREDDYESNHRHSFPPGGNFPKPATNRPGISSGTPLGWSHSLTPLRLKPSPFVSGLEGKENRTDLRGGGFYRVCTTA